MEPPSTRPSCHGRRWGAAKRANGSTIAWTRSSEIHENPRNRLPRRATDCRRVERELTFVSGGIGVPELIGLEIDDRPPPAFLERDVHDAFEQLTVVVQPHD